MTNGNSKTKMIETKTFLNNLMMGVMKCLCVFYCSGVVIYSSFNTFRLTSDTMPVIFPITITGWYVFATYCILVQHVLKKNTKIGLADGSIVLLIKSPLIIIGTFLVLMGAKYLSSYAGPLVAAISFGIAFTIISIKVLQPVKVTG